VAKVCKSHWPKQKDAVVTSVQVGPYDEKLDLHGGTWQKSMKCSDTLVVAQYQLLMMRDTRWPHCIEKPRHPRGTVLTLRVRGSGQFLTMPPGAFVAKGAGGGPQQVLTQNDNCRMVIPITEYHITCDRLKADQVPNWKRREGTVNDSKFLGEKPGTLLFDTWEIDHSFAPDPKNPARYKLTCVLRSRDIPVCQSDIKYAGWNEIYHGGLQKWVTVKIKSGGKEVPLYKSLPFDNLFIDPGCHDTDDPCK